MWQNAKDERERAEAFKTLSADPEVSNEIANFRKSVEARFGEDGAREMLRAAAAGTTFEHPSVPKAQQAGLEKAARSYSAARQGESARVRQTEDERLTARESQSARLKQ